MTETEQKILQILIDTLRQNILLVNNLNIIARTEHSLVVSDELYKISANLAGIKAIVEKLLETI